MSIDTIARPEVTLREQIEGIVAGRTFIPLREYGELIGLSADAIQKRSVRGTLPFATHRIGGPNSLTLVAAVDVYKSFGLTPPALHARPVQRPTAQFEVYPDGSLRLIG